MTIIAEIGINHNGNLHLAQELIAQAKENGADVAKFQFYDPAKIFGPDGSHPDKENYEFALTVQFGFEEAAQLKKVCDEVGIEFMASVFDEERFEWLEELSVKRYKIASRSVEHQSLCKKILQTGKETFISLGLWDEDNIPYTEDNAKYLYCVTKYPCQFKDISMPAAFMESRYEGFSDHTMGIEASLVAAARGAIVVEKHFTLNKGSVGPDHICSMTPDELKVLSVYFRRIKQFLKAT